MPQPPLVLELAKFDERRELAAAPGLYHVGGFAHEELTEVQGGQCTTGAAVGGVALRHCGCLAWLSQLSVSFNRDFCFHRLVGQFIFFCLFKRLVGLD